MLRFAADGDTSAYADPSGRRIVAASTDGSTLWLIREVTPFDPATAANEPEGYCTAALGGCEVVSVDRPSLPPRPNARARRPSRARGGGGTVSYL